VRVRAYPARVITLMATLSAMSCERQAQEPDPTECTQLGSLVLGPADTKAIRAHLHPAPPLEQMPEFALDVRATEYLETGVLGSMTWPEAIRAYRTRVREAQGGEGLAALQDEVVRARRELGVKAVSCTPLPNAGINGGEPS